MDVPTSRTSRGSCGGGDDAVFKAIADAYKALTEAGHCLSWKFVSFMFTVVVGDLSYW